MYKVDLSVEAEKDLHEIYKYIYENDSEINADYLIDKLKSKCFGLQEFPDRGHNLPELLLFSISDYLEIHFKSYRIIYRVYKSEVIVHCVLDGRRNISRILEERILR